MLDRLNKSPRRPGIKKKTHVNITTIVIKGADCLQPILARESAALLASRKQ